VTSAALERLVARFLDGTLPRAEWTHAAHLAVGAWHVDRFGADAAVERLRAGIRALNERNGVANTPTGGYHETITIAYVRLLARALADAAPDTPLADRVDAIGAGPLADRGFLLRFWSRERLMSAEARAAWVPPDLAPLSSDSESEHGRVRARTATDPRP
jgi:hypothetical protein